MHRRTILGLGLAGLTAGCGFRGSRFDPRSWFGRSRETPSTVAVPVAASAADPRPAIARIEALSVDRTPGGAILRATGLPPTQGWFDADLVRDPGAPEGRLAYTFRARPPRAGAAVSTPRSRAVVVATYVTDQALTGVREITVSGAENARSVAR